MQIRRFLGNIARAYLVIGALSAAAFAVADEYPIANNNWNGFTPNQGEYGCVSSPSCAPSPSYVGGTSCSTSCFESCNEAPHCAWGYNPPAYLHCGGTGSCGQGFLDSLRLQLDFLWWRANEEGLALGLEQTLTQGAIGTTVGIVERVKKPKFRFDAGVRVGIASICDCVDLGLVYTHYHTKAKVRGISDFSAFNPSTGAISSSVTEFYSFWEQFNSFDPTLQTGRWSLDLDLLDLEIGHKYYVSSCFVLRPHMGLRGARIDQGFRTVSESSSSITGDFYGSTTKSKCDFLGVGPRFGIDAEWKVGCGLSVFGQAAGSILFGRFDLHADELLTNDAAAAGATDFTTFAYLANEAPDRVSRATTDISIGLKWEHCFELCCRQHPFSLAFSWEHHGFYNFNNFDFRSATDPVLFSGTGVASLPRTGESSRKHGDLFTQGLTVSAEIGF